MPLSRDSLDSIRKQKTFIQAKPGRRGKMSKLRKLCGFKNRYFTIFLHNCCHSVIVFSFNLMNFHYTCPSVVRVWFATWSLQSSVILGSRSTCCAQLERMHREGKRWTDACRVCEYQSSCLIYIFSHTYIKKTSIAIWGLWYIFCCGGRFKGKSWKNLGNILEK